MVKPIIVTTTPDLQGRRIVDYLGIVNGEVILGADFVKDIFAGFRNIFGGRAQAYEDELEDARVRAITELMDRARHVGADAVVGISMDYEVITTRGNSMLMVCATGTAVRIEDAE